jgi:putative transposase
MLSSLPKAPAADEVRSGCGTAGKPDAPPDRLEPTNTSSAARASWSCQEGTTVLVLQAFRYELDPNNAQRSALASHAGAARYAWNWGLARVKEALDARAAEIATGAEPCARIPDAMTLSRAWNVWKKQPGNCSWWAANSKYAYQVAFRDLDRALRTFYGSRSRGKRRSVGFPRFKKKGRHDHFRLYGIIRVESFAVMLPRIGRVRLKERTSKFEGRIISATCKREADRWFVSLCVEVQRPDPPPVTGPAIGIDLGISAFAVCSDGSVIEAPRPLVKGGRKLRRLNKSMPRTQRGSRNRAKAALKLARHHRKMRNQRRDALHQATTRLAKTKSVIVVEDLNVAGLMRNHHVARQIADLGWGEFHRQLSYKTRWYGSQLVVADRFFPSSRTCSGCGHIMARLPLSRRTYSCEVCGVAVDRDLNAARNLARLADRVASGSGETENACGEGGAGTPGDGGVKLPLAKQEPASVASP